MRSRHLTYRQERERALAVAKELQQQIQRLIARPEHVDGSCPEASLDYLRYAISMLTPDRGDSTSNGDEDPSYIRAQRQERRDNMREVRP